MKRPNVFVKVAVVLSSVLLLSGFVAYRAGALDSVLVTNEHPANSGCDTVLEENWSDGTTPQAPTSGEWLQNWKPIITSIRSDDTPDIIIYGSKSAPVFVSPSNPPFRLPNNEAPGNSQSRKPEK